MLLPAFLSLLLLIRRFSFSSNDDWNEPEHHSSTIVATSFGLLQGSVLQLSNGQLVDMFLGVPYAQPPIGELRFEKAFESQKWKGIRLAMQHAPACVPLVPPISQSDGRGAEEYSEDCLYLDVYLPSGKKEKSHQRMPLNDTVKGKLPMLVMVQDDEISFAKGYDQLELCEKFVSKGIVVIAVRYRVGILGFASSGDKVMPGNLGLWDLVAALRWIRTEVPKAWTADPRRITLLGHGAAAAAISALSISPYSRELFSQAVQMSGSILAQNAVGTFVVNETRALAMSLGCPTDDSLELKQCLRGKRIEQIHEAVAKMGSTRPDLNYAKFTSREQDGQFFPRQDIVELIHESPPKGTLMGWAKMESLAFTLLQSQQNDTRISKFGIARERMHNSGQADFEHFIRENVAKEEYFGPAKAAKVQAEIIDFYANKYAVPGTNEKDSRFWLERYSMVLSDLQYQIPAVWELRLKAQWDWPLFLYEFAWVEPAMFPEWAEVREAYHGLDRDLVFGTSAGLTKDGREIGSMLAEAIANFVLKGNPSTGTLLWVPASRAEPMRHLAIDGPKPKMRNSMEMERLKFWHRLTETEHEFNLVKGTYQKAKKGHDEL